MAAKKILILTASIGSGHIKAAEAVTEELARQQPDAEIITVDFMARSTSFWHLLTKKLYLEMLNFVPNLYDVFYKLSSSETGGSCGKSMFALFMLPVFNRLQEKYQLICVTNNPVLPARKTLDAIGISDFFPEIVGLDTCFKSKPAIEPFQTAVDWLFKSVQGGIKAENCLAVGDRYDMDIALPLEMGMGGILVKGVEEVYQIPKSVI